MKIAFFSAKPYDKIFFDRYNKGHAIRYFTVALSEESAGLAEGSTAVCVFVNDKLNASVIGTLAEKGIKLIALRCAGYNNVDLAAAQLHGITVVRVPAYSPHAVAEHAVALLLTLNRKTHKAYNRVREGNFSLEKLTGFDLFGKTVGIIGCGRIGRVFCEIMLGFGCRVLCYDILTDNELEKKGVQFLALKELLAESDVVSLHCPLNEQTRQIINTETISLMKRGAMLINTSRGGLIETKAVIAALKRGQLGYLGIDVYEQEDKLFFKDLSEEVIQDDMIMRLIGFPNVLITAHQGFFTTEALTEIAKTTIYNIEGFEAGQAAINAV